MTNQYLIDYTVRNITTGDEEETRLFELTDTDFSLFPPDVRDEVRSLIRPAAEAFAETQLDYHAWDRAQMRILELLKPYIRRKTLYDTDYAAWEEALLEESL